MYSDIHEYICVQLKIKPNRINKKFAKQLKMYEVL